MRVWTYYIFWLCAMPSAFHHDIRQNVFFFGRHWTMETTVHNLRHAEQWIVNKHGKQCYSMFMAQCKGSHMWSERLHFAKKNCFPLSANGMYLLLDTYLKIIFVPFQRLTWWEEDGLIWDKWLLPIDEIFSSYLWTGLQLIHFKFLCFSACD